MLFYDSPSPAPNPRRVRIFAAEKGGYGFQTSPALAEIGAAMIVQRSLPSRFKENGITSALFAPERFARAT